MSEESPRDRQALPSPGRGRQARHLLITAADKPLQQPGTLPSLPISKSFLKRDATARARLTPQNRHALIEILARLLEDEYTLAAESDTYQRTSFTSNSSSKPPSFVSTRSVTTKNSLTSTSSYTTACEGEQVTTTRTASTMAKKAKKEPVLVKDEVKLTPLKKREAPQPVQTVRIVDLQSEAN